jgi:hypothetical protein
MLSVSEFDALPEDEDACVSLGCSGILAIGTHTYKDSTRLFDTTQLFKQVLE